MQTAADHDQFDFIVVGSGAGGGPLAANLAEAGFTVLLLEAGGEHMCPYYQVPIMQARASEDEDMRWDFFVRHYADRDKMPTEISARAIRNMSRKRTASCIRAGRHWAVPQRSAP